jgi:hypothetical protein
MTINKKNLAVICYDNNQQQEKEENKRQTNRMILSELLFDFIFY